MLIATSERTCATAVSLLLGGVDDISAPDAVTASCHCSSLLLKYPPLATPRVDTTIACLPVLVQLRERNHFRHVCYCRKGWPRCTFWVQGFLFESGCWCVPAYMSCR